MLKKIILILALICMFVLPIFGQTGNYTTSSNIVKCADYDHPGDAITAISSDDKTLLVTEAETCDANFTVPTNVTVKFERGGKWTINNGITVTFNGQIDAGLWQIFAYTGTGTLAGTPKVDFAYPQWWGAVADGTTDDTVACQNALDSGILNIKFSKGNFLIDSVSGGSFGGLEPASNTTLLFDNGVELYAKTNNSDEYSVIQLDGKSNVKIYNATIKGDRLTHTGTIGEWGHGIYIVGASDRIIIDNMKSYNCWGDGIYIGLTSNPSTNILVTNSIFDNNRRNGCSITSAKNVLFKNCKFLNTNGTDPQAGVDVEPNSSADLIQDIIFDSCYSYNNLVAGYIGLCNADNMTTPVSVSLKNCISDSDGQGFLIVDSYSSDGAVYFEDCYSFNAEYLGFQLAYSDIVVNINGLYVLNSGQGEQAAYSDNSGVLIITKKNDVDAGNLTARNVRVDSSDDKLLFALALGVKDGVTGAYVKDIDIEISTNVSTAKHFHKYGDVGEFSGYQRIKFLDNPTKATTADLNLAAMKLYRYQTITNEGATEALDFYINDGEASFYGTEYTFEVVADYSMTINFGDTYTLLPSDAQTYVVDKVGIGVKIYSNGDYYQS